MMVNASLRLRCISDSALEAIIELLREESNAIFIETFPTQEDPRTGVRAPVIYGGTHGGLGSIGGQPGRRSRAPKRT